MSFCKNKFWLENPVDLLCDVQLIPVEQMKLTDQMNSLTRLVILIFFIILPIHTKKSFVFLFLSLLFIIILYYIQKKTMDQYQIENYKDIDRNIYVKYDDQSIVKPVKFVKPVKPVNSTNIYIGEVIEQPNKNTVSANQKLAGNRPNPKTLIPLNLTPPPMAFDFWRANNSVNHSHINTESQFDNYLSGYEVSRNTHPVSEKYTLIDEQDDTPSTNHRRMPYKVYNNNITNEEGYNKQNTFTNELEYPYKKPDVIKRNESGWVNISNGYNPNQISESNLPSNLQTGKCEKSSNMKEYNKNLFTQNIQPDIYTRNEIIEPINSNIGISFTQQFEPTTSSTNSKGQTFVQHDPRLFNNPEKEYEYGITESNVYDPRFSGYGTSYRSYNEDVTGQTRFYYDDVNSVRMPNYISRSNIDFAKYADTYGPLTEMNRNGNVNTDYIREMAQDTFLQASLQQRTELQERLMRKRNSELWQLRKAPIQTSGQRQSGGKRY
jgi:hypothetical protein